MVTRSVSASLNLQHLMRNLEQSVQPRAPTTESTHDLTYYLTSLVTKNFGQI